MLRIPSEFDYVEARKLFKEPEITSVENIQLEWKDPDEAGLIEFLVNSKGFNIDRVKSAVKKLQSCKSKSTQKRLENFFGAVSAPSSTSSTSKKAKTSASGAKKPAQGKKK